MKIIISTFLVLASFLSFSQTGSELRYSFDVNTEFGLFASLNSHPFENLIGEKYSIYGTYFFQQKFGVRTGFSNVHNLESTNKFYTVPLQFVYRTKTFKTSKVIYTESLSDLFAQLIGSVMPHQYDINVGINLGYIEPKSDLTFTSINGGPLTQQGFSTERRFVSSLDFGARGKAKIGHFAFTISPTVSYLLSNNFKYYSEEYPELNYNPQWFLSMMLGLSYEF